MSSFHTLVVHAGERMLRPDFTPIYHSAAYIRIMGEIDAVIEEHGGRPIQ
jgi:hypothetical protein